MMTRDQFAFIWVYLHTVKHMYTVGIHDRRLFERIRSRKAITQMKHEKNKAEGIYDEHNGDVEHLLEGFPSVEEAFEAIKPTGQHTLGQIQVSDDELRDIIIESCKKYVKEYYREEPIMVERILSQEFGLESKFNEDLHVDSLGRIMVFMDVAEQIGIELLDMENELTTRIDSVRNIGEAIKAWREIEAERDPYRNLESGQLPYDNLESGQLPYDDLESGQLPGEK